MDAAGQRGRRAEPSGGTIVRSDNASKQDPALKASGLGRPECWAFADGITLPTSAVMTGPPWLPMS